MVQFSVLIRKYRIAESNSLTVINRFVVNHLNGFAFIIWIHCAWSIEMSITTYNSSDFTHGAWEIANRLPITWHFLRNMYNSIGRTNAGVPAFRCERTAMRAHHFLRDNFFPFSKHSDLWEWNWNQIAAHGQTHLHTITLHFCLSLFWRFEKFQNDCSS